MSIDMRPLHIFLTRHIRFLTAFVLTPIRPTRMDRMAPTASCGSRFQVTSALACTRGGQGRHTNQVRRIRRRAVSAQPTRRCKASAPQSGMTRSRPSTSVTTILLSLSTLATKARLMQIVISAAFALLVLVFSLDTASAAASACSQQQADAAEAAADHLTDWAKVSAYAGRFRACDEGGMAEASSEAVARLLVDKWQTLPDLAAEVHHKPSLRTFVLSHINSTLDTKDLKKIRLLSGNSCPVTERVFCEALKKAAIKALD